MVENKINAQSFQQCLDPLIPFLNSKDVAKLMQLPNHEIHQKLKTIVDNASPTNLPHLLAFKDGSELKKLELFLKNVVNELKIVKFFENLSFRDKLQLYPIFAGIYVILVTSAVVDMVIYDRTLPVHTPKPSIYTEDNWTCLISNLKFLLEQIKKLSQHLDANKNTYICIKNFNVEKFESTLTALENTILKNRHYLPTDKERREWATKFDFLHTEVNALLNQFRLQACYKDLTLNYNTSLGFFQKFIPKPVCEEKPLVVKGLEKLSSMKATIKNG